MKKEKDKEIEGVKNSSYDEMFSEETIILPQNPDWWPMKNPINISGGKTSTEILMEMRAEERCIGFTVSYIHTNATIFNN